MEELTDVRYEVEDGLAWITIDRPDRLNAFRARTIDELIACFVRAWASQDVGVVCLTGAGDRAFCTGGDQKQRAQTGDYGPSASGLFEVERLHALIVPAGELRAEVRRWADEALALSPTALRFVKQSFNADTEHIAGTAKLAFSGLGLFVDSDEAAEGVQAFTEKRSPDFSGHRARASA
jgi:1,4-dihydroxy-2-naphthoyl-CoA synthase